MESHSGIPAFKACGLCASIVDNAVELKKEMKTFLINFLDLNSERQPYNADVILPNKICISCYQETSDAKRFKERCIKAFAKLNNKEKGIPKSWILGTAISDNQANSKKEMKRKVNFEEDSKSKVEECDASRAPKSKTKAKDTINSIQNVEEKKLPPIENQNNATTEKYLKSHPVVEISWNGRQLGEISLKNCEVVIDPILDSDPKGNSKKLTPNTKKIVSTLHPRIRNSKEKKKDNTKKQDPCNNTTKQEQSCPDNQNENCNKRPRTKKGYIIETIDASGNVVMENGKLTSNAIESYNSPTASAMKQSEKTNSINDSSANENTAPISTEKVQQSRFGRSIRRSSSHSDFGYDTSSGSKRRRHPKAQLDNSISSPIVSSTQIESGQPKKASPSATEPTSSSKKIQEKKANGNRSSSRSSSQKKRKTDNDTKSNTHIEGMSLNDSIQSDPLKIQNSESSKSGVAINGDEDLVEAYPPHGPYQCELCQSITDSKEEFVEHIKTKHLEDVDDDVLDTLYGDLRKARRKMELAMTDKQNWIPLHDLPLTS